MLRQACIQLKRLPRPSLSQALFYYLYTRVILYAYLILCIEIGMRSNIQPSRTVETRVYPIAMSLDVY